MTASQSHPSRARLHVEDLNRGQDVPKLHLLLRSYRLHLRAERKRPATVNHYIGTSAEFIALGTGVFDPPRTYSLENQTRLDQPKNQMKADWSVLNPGERYSYNNTLVYCQERRRPSHSRAVRERLCDTFSEYFQLQFEDHPGYLPWNNPVFWVGLSGLLITYLIGRDLEWVET